MISNDLLAIHWFNTWRIRVEAMHDCARTPAELELFSGAACIAQAQYVAALALGGSHGD